jgi:Helix-turn-helix domain
MNQKKPVRTRTDKTKKTESSTGPNTGPSSVQTRAPDVSRQMRKYPPGIEGAFIEYDRVLRARREAMPVPPKEKTQSAFCKHLGFSQPYLGRLERGLENLPNHDLSWFEKMAPAYGWTTLGMLEALGIPYVKNQQPTVLTLEQEAQRKLEAEAQWRETAIQRGHEETQRFRQSAGVRFRKAPYLDAGGGPPNVSEQPAGEIWLEDDGFLDKHPNGHYFKIDGQCLEPEYPNGWFAAVVPDPALAYPRAPILIWFQDDGRAVKYLVQWREDGDHLLFQPNPPSGQGKLFFAPVGSSILGVIVDVKREIQPGRAVIAALEEEMPELLGELEL